MGYAFEGWKVTYTRRYDTDYGEYGTVTNVTIGDTNIPIGYHGIFSDGKGNENSLATESIARLIAAAPELHEELREMLDYAREAYAWYGGDDEKRGKAPRVKKDIERVEALLRRVEEGGA